MYSTEVRLKWPTLRTRTFTFHVLPFIVQNLTLKLICIFFFINGYEICFYQSTDNQLY